MACTSHNSASDLRQRIWVLLGPTAGGKTAVSLYLAQRHPVEIVSVDSMQVYRGMDIGTAKPGPEALRRAPHHMIDVVEPEESFNAGRFRQMALAVIEDIHRRGRRPLLICGTPLYLKALLWGLFEGPGADAAIRERLRREASALGAEGLHRRLAGVDPEAARRISPNDFKRIERALEVYELTGEPISAQQEHFDAPPTIEHTAVGLNWPRAALYRRIDERVDRMMAAGLLEEVRRLAGRLGPQASQAVGYKELLAHLRGEVGLAEAVRLIKRNSRRLAKHQLTWFRRFSHVNWVTVSPEWTEEELAQGCENPLLNLEHFSAFGYD